MFKKISSILIVVILISLGGFYAYNELVPKNTDENENKIIYSTENVKKGDIKVGVESTGSLNPSNNGSLKVPGNRYNGESFTYVIKELLKKEGQEVKKGEPVIRLESSDISKNIENKSDEIKSEKESLSDLTGLSVSKVTSINPRNGISIKAPIDGRIIDLDLETSDEIKESEVIAQMVDDSKYIVEAKLTTAEVPNFKVGDTVKLSYPYFSGILEGKVKKINSNSTPEQTEDGEFSKGFVYKCIIEGKNPGLVQKDMNMSVGYSSKDDDKIHYIKNQGVVKSFVNQENVLGTTDAIVTKVHVNNMEYIEKGTPIITMSGEDTRELIEEKLENIKELSKELDDLKGKSKAMTIKSPLDGVVSKYYRKVGEDINTGDLIGSVYNTNDMQMTCQIDDIDILNVNKGADVKVSVDAIPGKTYEGKVEYVSTSGEKENGIIKFRVNIAVKGGPKLRPGMQANAYIKGGQAKDVLLVPIEAVFEQDGKNQVEILKNGRPKAVNIKIGLMNNKYAEIKEGLKEGQEVITGSSNDMLPSEHIKSDDTILPSDSGGKDEEN